MQALIPIFIALILFNASYAQENIEDIEKGKESQHIIASKVSKRSGWLFSTVAGSEKDSVLRTIEEFDAAGQLTKRISHRTADSRYEETYKFTSKGLLIEYSTQIFPGDGKAELTRYKYDNLGNQNERVIYNKDGSLNIKWSIEYDENKYPVKKTMYHASNGKKNSYLFENKYKKDKPKEIILSDDAGKTTRTEYQYENDNLVKKEVFSAEKTADYTTNYTYNEAGQLVKEQVLKGEKPISSITYEYDSNGNRTLRNKENIASNNFTIWRYQYYPTSQLLKSFTEWEHVKTEQEQGKRVVWRYDFY